jgi:hypothetical protein
VGEGSSGESETEVLHGRKKEEDSSEEQGRIEDLCLDAPGKRNTARRVTERYCLKTRAGEVYSGP